MDIMDISLYALALIAVIYTLGFVSDHPLTSLYGKYGRRTKVMHQSVQPTQSNFALKEGQTLVGVIDTTKVMCFYIDDDRREEKPYEY
jgi:hypothetical protein